MAFTPPGERVPTTIKQITVMLADRIEWDGEPARQSATYQLVVLDQEGKRMEFPADNGNLAPHLTANQITQLQAFMASLRAQAEAQILEA